MFRVLSRLLPFALALELCTPTTVPLAAARPQLPSAPVHRASPRRLCAVASSSSRLLLPHRLLACTVAILSCPLLERGTGRRQGSRLFVRVSLSRRCVARVRMEHRTGLAARHPHPSSALPATPHRCNSKLHSNETSGDQSAGNCIRVTAEVSAGTVWNDPPSRAKVTL